MISSSIVGVGPSSVSLSPAATDCAIARFFRRREVQKSADVFIASPFCVGVLVESSMESVLKSKADTAVAEAMFAVACVLITNIEADKLLYAV